jgi:hypothetical protein
MCVAAGSPEGVSDHTCVPLCQKCRREYEHDPKTFVENHYSDVPPLLRMFNSFYGAEQKE